MEARLSPSPAASPTSGGEKEEKEREAEMEGNQLNRRESQEGAMSKEAIQGGPHFTAGHTGIPLTRASSISARQNPFSFKQDISHLPVVWAGLGLALCLPSSRSQGSRGLQPYPISPSLPLKLIARKTPCSRGRMGAQEAILCSWFPSCLCDLG